MDQKKFMKHTNQMQYADNIHIMMWINQLYEIMK